MTFGPDDVLHALVEVQVEAPHPGVLVEVLQLTPISMILSLTYKKK
jgi:hypothetical protein